MENEPGTKQPPRGKDESLQSPQPPKQVTATAPEVQEPVKEEAQRDEQSSSAEVKSFTNRAEKVQDYDWNNGKPEVTPDDVEPLPDHKTPEIQNDESLRENKGEKPGTDSFEASEEVNTGQSGG